MTDREFVPQHCIDLEPRGFDVARRELLERTRRQRYAALATSTPDGRPQVATLRFAVTDEFELVMGTLRTARKYANLRQNENIAFVTWADEFSIQIEGRFEEPTGSDLERISTVFASDFPYEAHLREGRQNHFFFRIIPTWARYSDFSVDPGRVLTLDFTTKTETRGIWPPITEE